MPPVVIAAGIVGAGALGSAVIGSKAAGKAANAQVAAADKASQTQKEIFDKQVALQEPFRQAGIAGQNRIMDLLGLSKNTGAEGFGKYARDFSMADFTADPGYQFRLDQGMKALNNSMAAKGLGISGANIKGATEYGQNMGSQEYQNAFNRYQINRANQLNPLQSLAGQGQSSANTMTNAAGQYGQNVSDLQTQAGNARASGYIGQSNAITGAIGSGLNAMAMLPWGGSGSTMPTSGWGTPGLY